jgi:hypothetical protein
VRIAGAVVLMLGVSMLMLNALWNSLFLLIGYSWSELQWDTGPVATILIAAGAAAFLGGDNSDKENQTLRSAPGRDMSESLKSKSEHRRKSQFPQNIYIDQNVRTDSNRKHIFRVLLESRIFSYLKRIGPKANVLWIGSLAISPFVFAPMIVALSASPMSKAGYTVIGFFVIGAWALSFALLIRWITIKIGIATSAKQVNVSDDE